MNEIKNAVSMLLMLQKKGQMKLKDIAKAIGVEERSIRRYRSQLTEAGIDIESKTGRYGGYCLKSEVDLDGISINEEEIHSLLIAERLLAKKGHKSAKDISSIINKINIWYRINNIKDAANQ